MGDEIFRQADAPVLVARQKLSSGRRTRTVSVVDIGAEEGILLGLLGQIALHQRMSPKPSSEASRKEVRR